MQKTIISSFAGRILLLSFLTIAARLPAGAANSDRVVVMISVDGLAAYYLDDPKADLPTLRQLAAEGARASMMKAVTPTVTWPNHTTLVTGDYPARHGVVGNNYYDRATGKKMVLIADPTFDKDEIVKVPTIYDVAKAAGMKTAAIRWPATRNAKTLDWTEPDVHSDELIEKYTTPSLMEECTQAGIHLLNKTDPNAPKDPDEPKDASYTRTFNLILHQHRPQLALLHIAKVDHIEHLKGPRSPDAYKTVHEADHFVREVWDELQRDFPNRATLIIVSDHGFSPIKKMILPNVVLAKAGLGNSAKGKTDGAAQLVTQGGAAFIYVHDESRRDEILAKVRASFTGLEGVAKVLGTEGFKDYGVADPKIDPHAPDMILFADEGYSFGDTAGGALPFNEKPERKGSHGHDPALPDLHATFIAWGAGIKPGVKLGEIQNIDVAPTIAKLLGLDLPNTDGKPLTAVLAQ